MFFLSFSKHPSISGLITDIEIAIENRISLNNDLEKILEESKVFYLRGVLFVDKKCHHLALKQFSKVCDLICCTAIILRSTFAFFTERNSCWRKHSQHRKKWNFSILLFTFTEFLFVIVSFRACVVYRIVFTRKPRFFWKQNTNKNTIMVV